jgi:hypothetical protein
MLAASHGELISQVLIDPSRAFIVRGWKSMATYRDFDIDEEYRTNRWKFDFAQTMHSASAFPVDGQESKPTKRSTAQTLRIPRLIDLWRRAAPGSIRRKVPPRFASSVQRHVTRSNP